MILIFFPVIVRLKDPYFLDGSFIFLMRFKMDNISLNPI